VLRVLEPALRMKAQTDSNSRGQKYFICREEKNCILGHGGKWGFMAFFALPEGGDAFQMQMDIP
jgi:hypothetical protein